MRHSEYTRYFRNIASLHPALRHSEAEMHFARIVLARDELGNDNIQEFISSLRTRIHPPFMLLVAYDHGYQNNGGDQRRKVYQCAFLSLDKAPGGDFDAEEAVYDSTEEIGEQILAYILHDFEEGTMSGNGRLGLENEMGGEKIGRVEGFTGTRFTLSFWQNYNGPLYHNPQNWTI